MGASSQPCEFVGPDGTTIPTVTASEMRLLDAEAERAGYRLDQMVEHAGRHLADLAFRLGAWRGNAPRVVILAGSGGNGAGALAAARHLANAGGRVRVALAQGREHSGVVVSRQLELLTLAGVAIEAVPTSVPSGADLIVDGLVGYGLLGPLRGPHRQFVEQIGAGIGFEEALVLSLDVPSGLSADGGATGTVVRPAATMSVALPKRGLLDDIAGDVWLADIGIPRDIFTRAGIHPPPRSVAEAGLVPLKRRVHRTGMEPRNA